MVQSEKNLIDALRLSVTGGTLHNCDNWAELSKIADYHHVQNLLAEVLPSADSVPSEIKTAISDKQILYVIKDANQESEVNKLINIFEKNKIPVVMLKGWIIKKLYPRPDMRTMSDTDIFIEKTDEKKIHDIIKSQGYSVVSFGEKKDNVYEKDPLVILEIHKNLFMYEDNWNDYFNCKDSQMYIWNRVKNISGYEYVYRMDDELFFVYMIAHIAKHLLDDGGIGVRSILDVWLYINKTTTLDYEVAFKDLEKLNLLTFAQNVIDLTRFWFENKENVPRVVEELGDHILKCGAHGNNRILVATKDGLMNSDNPSQLKYVFRRAFPTVEEMKVRFPRLQKNKWLLPALYIKRLWYSAVHRTSLIKNEITIAGEIDYEEVRRIQRLYKNIGLR